MIPRERTIARIQEATKLAPEFDGAIECGLGRKPPEQVTELMTPSAAVSGLLAVDYLAHVPICR